MEGFMGLKRSGLSAVFLMLQMAIAGFALDGASANTASEFVRVSGTRFMVGNSPYYFVGTNFWYGMNLGAEGVAGDRARLIRELDTLKSLGVTNLRILAASEGPDSEPWRVTPSVQPAAGAYREDVLRGLDFLLYEMSLRGMRAVVCLNNFWPWSGGMAQYLNWVGAGPIPYPPPQPGGDWGAYQKYTSQFYLNEEAMRISYAFMKNVITRTNHYSQLKYADDPTIMAWQLANEPRGIKNAAAFNHWINRASSFIKSLDRRHLVTVGVEGETPNPVSAGMDFVLNSKHPNVDYTTIHIWAQNWSWFNPGDTKTFAPAVDQMRKYLREHIVKAKALGKPLVVEEFGLGRDGDSHEWSSTTAYRDRYYAAIFEEVYRAAKSGAPVAGINFWAWSGEGRPAVAAGHWKSGDALIGDPPHEAQGWYGVYSTDATTLSVISAYAAKMSSLK
jgi:mannan endo-1,4-beta-mannosidase